MKGIKVRVSDIGNLKETATNFKVSISGIPENITDQDVIEVSISGIVGNVQSFISNAVDEERGIFKGGKTYFPCGCFF